MKGGYQVIEFNGASLAEDTVVKGAFAKAKSGKAILIEDVAGYTAFTYDCTPSATDSAMLPFVLYDTEGDAFINAVVVISNEDVCVVYVPES